jgi:DNA-binding Lrp family transcriptional regulator
MTTSETDDLEIESDPIEHEPIAALRNGPLSPRDLATQLGITPGNLRYTAAKLERSGVLVGTGSTTNRLLALSGRKEVP